jgi:hypothetical protein
MPIGIANSLNSLGPLIGKGHAFPFAGAMEAPVPMLTVREELAGLALGNPTEFKNLAIFPLFRPKLTSAQPGYMLLEEAIHANLARVSEVSDGGMVPELLFENHSPQPVLLLDGEELVGAKQNRVLNLTILAPARSTIQIPVSCVEAGRWHHNSTHFTSADAMQYSLARAARAKQVSKSLQSDGSRRSDQQKVWEDIAAKSARLNTESGTGAMRAIYEKHRDSVEHYLRAFEYHPHQTGMLYCIGKQMWGIDLLDHPAPMSRVFSRLLRGYALDAIDVAQAPGHVPVAEQMHRFLQSVAEAPTFAAAAVGMGKDVRISGSRACGGALWADDRYVHLCAFSSDPSDGTDHPRSGIARPSRRRM